MPSRLIYSNNGFHHPFTLWSTNADEPDPDPVAEFDRSMFVWVGTPGSEQDPMATPEKRDTLVAFCQAHDINILYLDMFRYLGTTNWSSQNVATYQSFIQAATAAGIAVWGLSGDVDWSDPGIKNWVVNNIINHIRDYNLASTPEQRFSGFMYDVEYWLDNGQTATAGLTGLCDIIQSFRTNTGLPAGAFAPFFFMDNSRPNVSFNGNSKQEGAHLMDFADAVVVGAYRKAANPFDDQNGQIQLMQPWMTYAPNGVAKVFCGAETNDIGDANVSYLDITYTEFEAEQTLITNEFEDVDNFGGISIHDYTGFSALYEDVPYLTDTAPLVGRAMYAWAETEALDPGQDPMTTPAKRAAMAQWCSEQDVSLVFLDIRNYVMIPNQTPSKIAKLRDMVARLSAVGCQTYAMAFDLAWLNINTLPTVETNLLHAIADYNASVSPNERFTGVHYDIEYWLQGTYSITDSLIALKALMTSTKNITGLPVGMFSAGGLINGTTYTVDGVTTQQGKHMTDFCDYMVPAAYFDNAPEQITILTNWMTYADSTGKKIWGASETINLVPDPETYYGSSRPEMEEQFALIMAAYAGRPSWMGMAVHSYDGWRALYPTPPPVGFNTVGAVSPDVGDTSGGGQPITINGYGFVEGMTIKIGGVDVSNITINSSTQLTCIPGANTTGVKNIEIILPGDSADSTRGTGGSLYEYWTPRQLPSIDSYLDSGKGTTLSGSNVSQWTDQSANAIVFTQATGADQPLLVNNVFGTLPALRFTKGQGLTINTARLLDTGLSAYVVSKFTSSDTTTSDGYDVPLTIIGNSTATAVNSMGFSAGTLAYQEYFSGTTHLYTKAVSVTLNDGQPWLAGWTHITGGANGNLRYYVGMNTGATNQTGNVPYDTVNNGYNSIGRGRTADNGFEGDLGAVIIVKGTMNATNRAKLHKWATQRFGVSSFNMS